MDNQPADIRYCQSCGMPLRFDVEAYLGTNTDQSPSDEYCYYCLKDGEYTVDIPMQQMVDIWVKYTDKYNWYSDTNYTPEQLKAILNKRLPTLKRWRQKAETQNLHSEGIHKVRAYIDQNLFTELEAESLCEMINLSFFHFRKVFKEITKENVGAYIQRLRLEYVAHLLVATNLSPAEILRQTNYQTKFSLAKAFGKHFGVSMLKYREKYTISAKKGNCSLIPEIRRLNTQKAICIYVGESFRDENKYREIWAKLTHLREALFPQKEEVSFVCLSMDNPGITSREHCRFYLGLTVHESIVTPKGTVLQDIPGGMYAIFRHKGSYGLLPDLYRMINEEWLPQSGYFQKYPLSFELYLNSPQETDISELLTAVYIPIEKIR